MTMPALIDNYQKQETVSRLQKVYSILSQAVKLAELNEGEIRYWDFSLSQNEFYKRYLKPYMIISQEYINTNLPYKIQYKCLNGKSCSSNYSLYNNTQTPKIILNDGAMIAIDEPKPQNFTAIMVDINGYKKPNEWGRDVFAFSIQEDYGVTAYGFRKAYGSFGDKMNKDAIINSSNIRACKKGKDGIWCSALIMMDGWQISKDYPW